MFQPHRSIAVAGCALLASAGATFWHGATRATAQTAPTTCDTPTTPFCSSTVALPPGWTGASFVLSQQYPATVPADTKPWLAFNPVTQPNQYIQSVIDYFYEGNVRANVDTSFDPKLNTVRAWFNAPWQDAGLNGREPLHGLTRERVSQPGELAPGQTSKWNNYAVGFYNSAGAVAIGKMWANHGKPDPTAVSNMPEGTVAAKLLFTTATVAEVPYLQGSPEWNAYIFAAVNNSNPKPNDPRAVTKVRLLQIDIAVKDSRSPVGWVFGTFVYGSGPGGKPGSGWTNIAPVGLMWGNDPGYSGSGPLTQTWINPAVTMPHIGYQGRLNGPVDNKISSCLSCHSTAETPAGSMVPPSGGDPSRWFRNIPSGMPFDPGRTSLDYSLQIAVGLSNFQSQKQINAAPLAKRKLLIKKRDALEAKPARDGGP